MNHRIFIAINLPEDVKKQLSLFQLKWPDLPCRWTKKENLHITLVFLGYVKDEELPETLEIVRETASKNKSFLISLKKICYGPTDKKPYSETGFLAGRRDKVANRPPRMVWAEGEKSREMAILQTDLENALAGNSSRFELDEPRSSRPFAGARVKEKRAFAPHITLGRLKLWEFNALETEEKPEVSEEISLSFEVSSIEIMESKLKLQGPDYFILESMTLGEK